MKIRKKGPPTPTKPWRDSWKAPKAGYLLSLPERTVRSTGALAGGLVHEISEVILPPAFRRTKLYQSLVDTALRFLVEEVGNVKVRDRGAVLPQDFVLRKAAGNGIELTGILLFHLSPVWVLAALSDLTSAGRTLLREISESLQEQGLLESDLDFDSLDQILDGLERTTGRLADNINVPPLDVPRLRSELSALKKEASRVPLPSVSHLQRTWGNLTSEAQRQRVSVFQLSSLLALSAVSRLPRRALWLSQCAATASRAGSSLLARSLLDHYTSTLALIHRSGYFPYLAKEFRPYLMAAANHFSQSQASYTERFLSWCFRQENR
ncbi:MAG: hypothetical protein AB1898_02845 [Acidobacteriota bacterium]